jgi:choloylglycine hydrolase
MYFDSATSPTVFWLQLESLSFDAGVPVKRLSLKAGETYSGDASGALKPAEPFAFLPAKPD